MTRARMQLIAGAAMCLLALASAGPAIAAPGPTSQITSILPSGPYLIDNQVTGQETIAVSGTTTGLAGSSVDLNCYFGDNYAILAQGVTVAGDGSFSWSGTMGSSNVSANGIGELTCVLRAVPGGDSTEWAPGQPSPFSGPTLNIDRVSQTVVGAGAHPNALLDYFFDAPQPLGGFAYQSLGDCSIAGSFAEAPVTFGPLHPVDYCNGGFGWEDGRTQSVVPPVPAPGYQLPTQSEILVDGIDAYVAGNFIPASALNFAATNPGFPALSYRYALNRSTGALTLDETDQVVRCLPGGFYPPSGGAGGNCTSFTPTGVQVHVHVVQSRQGRVATITQYFSSTDRRAHWIDLLEDNEFVHAPPTGTPTAPHGGELDFPWTGAGMAQYTTPGVSVPGPPTHGPGSFFVKVSDLFPDGALQYAQGAVTFATAPTKEDIVAATNSPADGSAITWVDLSYRRLKVLATGSRVFGFSYADAFLLSELRSDAAAAQASFTPKIRITSPGHPVAAVHRNRLVVSGIASDATGLTQVTVDGYPARLRAGRFRITVPLGVRTNAVTAVATNVFGNRAQSVVIVLLPGTPRISHVHQAHRRWRERGSRGGAPVGTAFRFSLNEPARVTFTVAGPVLGSFAVSLPAGPSTVRFFGHAGGRRLVPGRYSVAIVAQRGLLLSPPADLRFTIVS